MTMSSPWITRPQPRPHASLRVFCFPYAGAGGVIYRDWAKHAPEHVELCAIELPGHFGRRQEPLIRDIAELIPALERAIQPWLDLPFAFFGYSLGALVSFELARAIRRRSRVQPSQLVFAAAQAAHLPRNQPMITQLPRPAFAREVERRYGAFDALLKSEPELLELVLEITQADMAILESYHYRQEPAFDCPILALGGESDDTVIAGGIDAWAQHTTRSFQSRSFPGGHFFLRTSAAALRQVALDTLCASGSAALSA